MTDDELRAAGKRLLTAATESLEAPMRYTPADLWLDAEGEKRVHQWERASGV